MRLRVNNGKNLKLVMQNVQVSLDLKILYFYGGFIKLSRLLEQNSILDFFKDLFANWLAVACEQRQGPVKAVASHTAGSVMANDSERGVREDGVGRGQERKVHYNIKSVEMLKIKEHPY